MGLVGDSRFLEENLENFKIKLLIKKYQPFGRGGLTGGTSPTLLVGG